jgi:integrase
VHHSPTEVRQLLTTAETIVETATTAWQATPTAPRCLRSLFAAEQTLLVVRLAADSAARRGEIAALRLGDLDDRVLTIQRNLSHGVPGSIKSSRTRRLTLGATTAALIPGHVAAWCERWPIAPVDDWLFSPDPTRATHLRADVLSHRVRRLGLIAGVPGAALHRLRHGVATHLVDEGKLKAHARLGHRDPATTLRHYAHAVALDDLDVADDLDRILNGPGGTAVA